MVPSRASWSTAIQREKNEIVEEHAREAEGEQSRPLPLDECSSPEERRNHKLQVNRSRPLHNHSVVNRTGGVPICLS